jgi:Flp pilus assembly protein TadD
VASDDRAKAQLTRTARRCLNAGDERGALSALETFLDLDRTSPQAWADVGFLLADVGRKADALRHYERALELDPSCAAAWVGMGMQLAGEAAIRCFDRAIAAMPDDGNPWFLKSVALNEVGRPDEAAACLARARALSPGTFG